MNLVYKLGAASWILTRVEDAGGSPVTGLVFNSVGLSLRLASNGSAGAVKVLAGAGEWIEVGDGYYWVALTAADLAFMGVGALIVKYQGVTVAHQFRVEQTDFYDLSASTEAAKLAAQSANTTTQDIALDVADLVVAAQRLLGLVHDNVVIDQQAYGGPNGELTGARLRAYDSAANAQAAGAGGLLYTYTVFADYTGGNLSLYRVTRAP